MGGSLEVTCVTVLSAGLAQGLREALGASAACPDHVQASDGCVCGSRLQVRVWVCSLPGLRCPLGAVPQAWKWPVARACGVGGRGTCVYSPTAPLPCDPGEALSPPLPACATGMGPRLQGVRLHGGHGADRTVRAT